MMEHKIMLLVRVNVFQLYSSHKEKLQYNYMFYVIR